ncbi:4Fe-4S dicluster domain-containing protein [Campylobacter sp. RM15925]|uniref:4Fe-4S dicluster domain-containing protein n=1 Tax=Campylobacter sp. RM15925 TaxID=1705724 RepID=UPI001473C25E|nr:4Fe-4S dicluster domain-containing protein [Campylobacter sp. RM15925]
MKEFGFYNDFDDSLMLNEQIEIAKEGEYLISNSDKLKADIIAPEINFYLKNSSDSVLDKAKNTLLLYEARAHGFDLARDVEHEKEVGKNVVIVSNTGREKLAEILKENGFKVIEITHFEMKFVYGAAGELSVIMLRENDEFEVDCDFLLVENARDYMLKQSGCYEIANMSDENVLNFMLEKSPKFKYKTHIFYDSTICQYHERRQEICGRCADVCPTVAILKEDATKHLVFSHIDCLGCGGCISVCPSGALDYSYTPRVAFGEIAKMYKGKIALIVPKKMDLANLSLNLPAGVLPFAVEGEKWLHEAHFMTLLQESGASVIFYTDFVSRGSKDAIDIVNQIYEIKFARKAVYVAMNEKELKDALSKATLIEGSQHSIAEYAMPKREIFAKRLEWLVGDENLGVVKTGENISYGTVEINRDTCTLCLSCVGACNVSALVTDTKTNSIMFNPSICTNCGYCEVSCAEKDTIVLKRGEIELKPEYFVYNELARDELFACIECGKEFATKKAVEKIASIMGPKFASDPIKHKTLYCCADCKAKVMVQAQIEMMQKDIFNG